jgi:osmoprotectant transport system substrate-binding protein
MKTWIKYVILLLISTSLVACGPAAPADAPVSVATMLDAEGSILGKMIILILEDEGIPTLDRINFGTPDILRAALENGEVDLVVDYTGSGQYYHPDEALGNEDVWNNPEAGFQFTADLDLAKFNIMWLTPAPANNTEAIALRRDFAQQNNLRSMQDLANFINAGNAFKLIASASFIENPKGLIGFENAYGFKLRNDQLISLASGNTAEMLKALAEGTNDVNASLVYGTDGALDKLDLIVLEDPQFIPPVYLPAPVIRGEVLSRFPRIEVRLRPVFESLDLVTLQTLNALVAYDGLDATDVARAYLIENNFIRP